MIIQNWQASQTKTSLKGTPMLEFVETHDTPTALAYCELPPQW